MFNCPHAALRLLMILFLDLLPQSLRFLCVLFLSRPQFQFQCHLNAFM
ncbi:hypothetical protein J699_01482 [Acinetobacter sp. 1000160]|nr:hypothetical protein J699_01482 [Acinetobacter sp. 1000160]